MYAITKLGPNSQAFLAEMSSLNLSRSTQSSIALAKVLTFCTAIPTSAVEDIEAFFRTHVQLEIEKTISAVNELMVLDVKAVQAYCLMFYKQRYQAAHPTCHVFSFNKETAVEDFFGISRVVDTATVACIKEDPTTLASRINKFKVMVEELTIAPKTLEQGVPQ